MKTEQSRWRSPLFWSAFGAQLLSLAVLTGILDPNWSATAENFICALLELLVAVGLLNNPTAKGGF